MKRICLLLFAFSLLLCGCRDAEFYAESAQSLESAASETEPVSAPAPKYLYAILESGGKGGTVRGNVDTICRINLETGEALPLCSDPTCRHNSGKCTAIETAYFDVTDDGTKVYFWRQNLDAGTGAILYEYDTATLETKEIDRTESWNLFLTVLAFDDGVVYDKRVYETDEEGNVYLYRNDLYKYDGKQSKLLASSDQLWCYTRVGQYAYVPELEHFVVLDSNLQKIGFYDYTSPGNVTAMAFMGRSYVIDWEQQEDGTNYAYSVVPKADGTYTSYLLSECVDSTARLQDYVLLTETSDEAHTVHCFDPFTGERLYSVAMADILEQNGVSDVTLFIVASGRGAQMRVGNYQLFTARGTDELYGLCQVSFLFNAATGEVRRIDIT